MKVSPEMIGEPRLKQKQIQWPQLWLKVKKVLMGRNDKAGWIPQIIKYILLITLGFVFLYPLIYMLVTSFKSLDDLLNTGIKWLPSKLYLQNYKQAFAVLHIRQSLLGSILISFIPTIFQVVVCGIVGYGFARFEFPFKRTLFVLLIFSFIVPPQITMMPTYVLYSDLDLLGKLSAFIIPAALGNGIKSAIFILIYYQFFRQTPNSLYEAAEVDGASEWTCFIKVGVPMAVPAIIIVFLFSCVWYWNETYLVTLYLRSQGGSKWSTVLTQLQSFKAQYASMASSASTGAVVDKLNEGITMAATMITIIPLLITYFALQKYFVESVDRSGITGE